MLKNKFLRWLLILVVVIIALLWISKKMGWIKGDEILKVATEKASRRTIVETVSASGKIYPVVEVKISPDVSGEVRELFVKEGDSVHAGQVLAKINPDIYMSMLDRSSASLNASQSAVKNSQAQMQQVQSQFDKAEKDFQRNESLFKQGVISQSEFDAAKALYDQASAQLNASHQNILAAQFNVKSAAANVKEANDNLSKTTIVSPMTGIISRLDIKKGERVVGTSQMAGTEMMRIANFDEMEVRVDVNENDVIKIHKGDSATVLIDAYLDRKFLAVVTEIANSAGSSAAINGMDQATTYAVHIRLLADSYKDLLAKNPFPFRPGMSASAEIKTYRTENAVAVPIQSVTLRDEKSDSTQKNTTDKKQMEVVYILKADAVKEIKIESGVQDDSYIEIKSGLTGNEEVVTAPYAAIARKLKDGTKVIKVKKEELDDIQEMKKN